MRGTGFSIMVVVIIALVGAAFLIGMPTYNVYAKTMAGKAAYEEAVQNRRIRVLEAQALLDAAELTAQAEVARAKGTNEALQETAGSGDRQIIYLPTEAGMPILEAGRRPPGN